MQGSSTFLPAVFLTMHAMETTTVLCSDFSLNLHNKASLLQISISYLHMPALLCQDFVSVSLSRHGSPFSFFLSFFLPITFPF